MASKIITMVVAVVVTLTCLMPILSGGTTVAANTGACFADDDGSHTMKISSDGSSYVYSVDDTEVDSGLDTDVTQPVRALNSLLYVPSSYDDSGAVNANISWYIEGTTLYIDGTGAIPDYTTSSRPSWESSSYWSSVVTIYVNDGITALGDCTFYGAGNITELYLSDDIRDLGDNSLLGMSALDIMQLPIETTASDWVAAFGQNGVAQVACARYMTWLLTQSGKVYGTGYNNYGQQGSGNTTDVTTFTDRTPTGETVTQIICGETYESSTYCDTTWLLTQSGKVYGTGYNSKGQQGSGDTTNVKTFTDRTPSGETVTQVACSGSTTWLVTQSGKVYGTGDNYYGIQGSGSTTNVKTFTDRTPSGETVTQVACSGSTTWLVTQSGKVYGTGYNSKGQQGSGDTTNVKTFTDRTPSGETVTQVACSGSTTWLVTQSGKVYGTGDNSDGQQGSGNTTNVKTFTDRTPSGETVTQVACSGNTTWLVTQSGKVYGTGDNYYGIQGSGSTTDVTTFTDRTPSGETVTQVACSDYTTWLLTQSGKVYGTGYNNYGQQGSGNTTDVTTFTDRTPSGETVTQVACSSSTTWLLTQSGKVYGTGYNSKGQQGSGNTTDVTTFTDRTPSGETVTQVACSGSTTWLVTQAGKVYGAGYNYGGQQGSGNTTDVTTFTQRLNLDSTISTYIMTGTTGATFSGTEYDDLPWNTYSASVKALVLDDTITYLDDDTFSQSLTRCTNQVCTTISDRSAANLAGNLYYNATAGAGLQEYAGTTVTVAAVNGTVTSNQTAHAYVGYSTYSATDTSMTISGLFIDGIKSVTATTEPYADTDQYSYTFDSWSSSSGTVTAALTLTANYTATLRTFTVTFTTYSDSAIAAQTIAYGGTVTEPADPSYPHASFEGWLYDGQTYDFSTAVTGDMTLTATYEQLSSTILVIATTALLVLWEDGAVSIIADTAVHELGDADDGDITYTVNGLVLTATDTDSETVTVNDVIGYRAADGDLVLATTASAPKILNDSAIAYGGYRVFADGEPLNYGYVTTGTYNDLDVTALYTDSMTEPDVTASVATTAASGYRTLTSASTLTAWDEDDTATDYYAYVLVPSEITYDSSILPETLETMVVATVGVLLIGFVVVCLRSKEDL